ncbi:hypothetical protein [Streptomyces sp. NPDC002785]
MPLWALAWERGGERQQRREALMFETLKNLKDRAQEYIEKLGDK